MCGIRPATEGTAMDSEGDSADGGRWMTYAEIAALRRISRTSAERLVRRRRWRRQPDNRGGVRVLVPEDWLAAPPADAQPDIRSDRGPDNRSDIAQAFRCTLEVLREQQAAERAGWSQERTHLCTMIDGLQREVSELKQAQAAERTLGRLARLRRAWRRD
jgi:hypothetical protein